MNDQVSLPATAEQTLRRLAAFKAEFTPNDRRLANYTIASLEDVKARLAVWHETKQRERAAAARFPGVELPEDAQAIARNLADITAAVSDLTQRPDRKHSADHSLENPVASPVNQATSSSPAPPASTYQCGFVGCASPEFTTWPALVKHVSSAEHAGPSTWPCDQTGCTRGEGHPRVSFDDLRFHLWVHHFEDLAAQVSTIKMADWSGDVAAKDWWRCWGCLAKCYIVLEGEGDGTRVMSWACPACLLECEPECRKLRGYEN